MKMPTTVPIADGADREYLAARLPAVRALSNADEVFWYEVNDKLLDLPHPEVLFDTDVAGYEWFESDHPLVLWFQYHTAHKHLGTEVWVAERAGDPISALIALEKALAESL